MRSREFLSDNMISNMIVCVIVCSKTGVTQTTSYTEIGKLFLCVFCELSACARLNHFHSIYQCINAWILNPSVNIVQYINTYITALLYFDGMNPE